jgi:hypothetical protein
VGRESEGERKREVIIEVGNGKRSGRGRLAGRKRWKRKREAKWEKKGENDEEEKRREGREKRKQRKIEAGKRKWWPSLELSPLPDEEQSSPPSRTSPFYAVSTLTDDYCTTAAASGYFIASCYANAVGDATAAAYDATADRRPSTAACIFSLATATATLTSTTGNHFPSWAGTFACPAKKTSTKSDTSNAGSAFSNNLCASTVLCM